MRLEIAARSRWLFAIGLGLSGLLFVGGCGQNAGRPNKPTGTLSGTASAKGAPIAAGSVNLLSAEGVGAMAKIEAGKFKFDAPIEVGDYKVSLSPPRPEPQPPGTAPKPLPQFDVPKKYLEPATSGLSVTVKEGENTLPIDVKD